MFRVNPQKRKTKNLHYTLYKDIIFYDPYILKKKILQLYMNNFDIFLENFLHSFASPPET